MIKKSDNGNSVVIAGRQDYIKKMNILIVQKKFIKGNLKNDTLPNFAVNQKEDVDKVFNKGKVF